MDSALVAKGAVSVVARKPEKAESSLRGTIVTARWIAALAVAVAVMGQGRQSGHRLGGVACVGLYRQFGGHSRALGGNSVAIPLQFLAIRGLLWQFAVFLEVRNPRNPAIQGPGRFPL